MRIDALLPVGWQLSRVRSCVDAEVLGRSLSMEQVDHVDYLWITYKLIDAQLKKTNLRYSKLTCSQATNNSRPTNAGMDYRDNITQFTLERRVEICAALDSS